MEAKVALVEKHREEYGLNRCLRALRLSKGTSDPGPGAGVLRAEGGARDNPWIESLWGHFKVENESLLSEAATLEELEWVIGRQMRYESEERRHSGVAYVPPVEYLRRQGIHLPALVETGPPSGSVSGAQVRSYIKRLIILIK